MASTASAAEPAADNDQPGVRQHLVGVAAFCGDAADDAAGQPHAVHAVHSHAQVCPVPAAAACAVYAVCEGEASEPEHSDGVECCVAVGRRFAGWQLAAAPRDRGS